MKPQFRELKIVKFVPSVKLFHFLSFKNGSYLFLKTFVRNKKIDFNFGKQKTKKGDRKKVIIWIVYYL